jgi:hypothetical protein
MSQVQRKDTSTHRAPPLEQNWTREAIRILQDVAPGLVSPAITELAKAGDIVRCNAIYESGVLKTCVDRHVAYAVLPIKSAVKDGEFVKFLVDDWIMQMRGYEAPRVNSALREIEDPAIVRELLQLGANPNVLKGAKYTPIGAALHARHTEALREMLLSVKETDQAPMIDRYRSIFDCILDPACPPAIAGDAMAAVNEIASYGDLPRSFRRAAGQALHDAATDREREPLSQPIENALVLMTYATLPAANYWAPVLRAGEKTNIADWLVKEGASLLGAQILRNMVANNFDPDRSLSYAGSKTMNSKPLLHAAVSVDNARLVKLLIDLGADPWAAANIDGVDTNAFALARAVGAADSEAVLRASQASSKVVALGVRSDSPYSRHLKQSSKPG